MERRTCNLAPSPEPAREASEKAPWSADESRSQPCGNDHEHNAERRIEHHKEDKRREDPVLCPHPQRSAVTGRQIPFRVEVPGLLSYRLPQVSRVPVHLAVGGLREVHAAEEGVEAGVRPEGIKSEPDIDKGQQPVSFLGSPLEPGNGLVPLAESEAHVRHEEARKVRSAPLHLQVAVDGAGFLLAPGQPQYPAQIPLRDRVVLTERHRLLHGVDCLVVPAEADECPPKLPVRDVIGRVNFQRATGCDHGVVESTCIKNAMAKR